MVCHLCHEATNVCQCVTLPTHTVRTTRPAEARRPRKAPTKPLLELIATWEQEATIAERSGRTDGYGALCRQTAAELRKLVRKQSGGLSIVVHH